MSEKEIHSSSLSSNRDIVDVEKRGSADLGVVTSRTEAELHDFHYDAAALHNTAVVNNAIEICGMGRYQWQMFFTCGFGFFVDQVCLALLGATQYN